MACLRWGRSPVHAPDAFLGDGEGSSSLGAGGCHWKVFFQQQHGHRQVLFSLFGHLHGECAS